MAEVGRLSTLAGCASDLFSDASAAAVTWAIMKPELRPGFGVRKAGRPDSAGSISSAMRRSAMRADLGDRQRHRVGREGHRLGVEVAAGQRLAGVGEDQRVVGDGVGLAHQHGGGMAHQVEAGAHHLRLAAQAVRVLHALVADEMRGADRAAGEQRAERRGDVDLARLAAHRVDARIERRVAALGGVDDQRAGDQRRLEHALGLEQRRRAPARSRPACR